MFQSTRFIISVFLLLDTFFIHTHIIPHNTLFCPRIRESVFESGCVEYVWYALPTRIFTVSRAQGTVTPLPENMQKCVCLNSDYTNFLKFRFIHLNLYIQRFLLREQLEILFLYNVRRVNLISLYCPSHTYA